MIITEEQLNKWDACDDGAEYVIGKDAKTAWDECERGDWMLWTATMRGVDLKVLTLAKVRCARLVQHLMKDQRSIDALDVVERFAEGKATREELANAVDGAFANVVSNVHDGAASYYACYASYYACYVPCYVIVSAVAETAADVVNYVAGAAASSSYGEKEPALNQCADICRDTIDFKLLDLGD